MIKSIGQIKKSILFTIIGLIIIILIIAYLIFKSHSTKPVENVGNGDQQTIDIQDAKDQTEVEVVPEEGAGVVPASAADFYDKGLESFKAKKYSEAKSSFESAIAIDPANANYYAKKSESEYNLGQKEEAIKTVEAGLKVLPDNDYLKTKLDILNKEWFGDQPQ